MRFTHPMVRALRIPVWIGSALSYGILFGQTGLAPLQSAFQPVTFTAEQDHQNMIEQLGIKALRPGPSGNEKAPNHANYDEAKANPFPNLPDPLTLENGEKVRAPAMWWHERRPEIVEDFEREVYGRVPADVPKVTWSVSVTDKERIGFDPVVAKEVIGHVDNSAYPLINVNIRMTLVTPANAKGPVPVLMMFGHSGFPAANQPSADELERINAALKALLVQQDPSLREVFEQHPAYELETPPALQVPSFIADGDPPTTWQLIADGWGFATIDPGSIQADDGADSPGASSGSSTRASLASPMTGGRYAPGPGVRDADSTIWKRTRRWTRSTLASRASHALERLRLSPWPLTSALPWFL